MKFVSQISQLQQGGGIIISRRAVLLPAAMDPSIYDSLSTNTQDQIEAINLKAPGDMTEGDILTLAQAIREACEC